MDEKIDGDSITFGALPWDTEFFGIPCAKAILHKPVAQNEWNDAKEKFGLYRFVSIENRNSEPVNSQFIGNDTSAFLADINIQFVKKPESTPIVLKSINICQSLDYDARILELADFKYSKFIEDPNFAQRGGKGVYRQWVINSFGRQDKYFAIHQSSETGTDGFLLYSFLDKACIIELIAVSNNMGKKGIGSELFKAVENSALQHGFDEIRVGTQLRNIGAINFYHKLGCKMVGCHQTYHLWNS